MFFHQATNVADRMVWCCSIALCMVRISNNRVLRVMCTATISLTRLPFLPLYSGVAACANTITASQQIQATHNLLSGTKYGMLWLDIEGSQYWYSDTSKNVNFIQELVNESKALNITVGIYSGNSQWTPITGSSKAFSNLPIWYAHYENTPNPSYSDWVPFGGWASPAIKQFKGTTSICGASVDENFY